MKKQLNMSEYSSSAFLPMNLQLFGASGDGSGEGGSGDGSAGSNGGENGGEGENPGGANGGAPSGNNEPGGGPVSFDDFLKEGKNQAEFDRRLSKAVDTALKKYKDKQKLLADEQASEAEKLKKMSEDEKREYEYNKQLKALQEREAEISRKELMAEAKATLAEKQIPADMASFLDYSDAEKCKASIEALEKSFKGAVETAVKDKLKGAPPIKKAPAEGDAMDELKKKIDESVRRGLI